MNRKVKEKFERTRNVQNNDKSKNTFYEKEMQNIMLEVYLNHLKKTTKTLLTYTMFQDFSRVFDDNSFS